MLFRNVFISIYLKFYPNGHQNSDIGWTHLFLRIASFPSYIQNISIYSQLSMENTNTKFHIVAKYSKDSPSWGWKKNKLKTENIQNLKEFKFKVLIRIIDIFDNNKDIITNKFIKNNNNKIIKMPICKNYGNECFYIWNINDINIIENIKNASKGMNFLSPMFNMFGLKWYLELIPIPDVDIDNNNNNNNQDEKQKDLIFESTFYICLASSSPIIENITISYKVELIEMNIKNTNCGYLYDNYSALVTGCIIPINMNKCQKLTFKFSINFIDIYDKFGNNLTKNFISQNNNNKFAKEIELNISDEYEWNILNDILLNKIKNASPGEFFLSNEFIMHGFKWVMKIERKN